MGHALERLWIIKSYLTSDRKFCYLRQSMHFFINNLLYYIQVDVIDCEYNELMNVLLNDNIIDFQIIMKTHKLYINNIIKLTFIDNIIISEIIDSIIQQCLRFLTVIKLLHNIENPINNNHNNNENENENTNNKSKYQTNIQLNNQTNNQFSNSMNESKLQSNSKTVVVIPPEEMEDINITFYSLIKDLIQIMNRNENRGFIFRLDFNGYFTNILTNMNLNKTRKINI